MSPHDFGDMHESALIFVPAATFGQLIPKCDTALQPLHDFSWRSWKVPRAGKARGAALTGEKEEVVVDWRSKRLTRSRQQAAPAANVSKTMRFALGARIISANACWRGF